MPSQPLKYSTISAAAKMPSQNSGWKLAQYFGEKSKNPQDAGSYSALEYDETGDYLAAGDRCGRVVILNRHKDSKSNEFHVTNPIHTTRDSPSYKLHTEFKSHFAEFDYLKSLEIEEKINKIKWCKSSNNSLYVLSTNDKTIKLWKVYDKAVNVVKENMNSRNINRTKGTHVSPEHLQFPTVEPSEVVTSAVTRKVYSNAHAYHINSIALNSDGETYLSADDLRINLWSLGISDQSFNIVDIKPNNMEELTEVITAADFHPTHCNIMMYSSSRGAIKLGDMRQSALCDKHAMVYEEQEDPSNRTFFSEIIASISDVKFSPDGRYILARDYLTLKLWDLNMDSRPVRTMQIHEQLRPKLPDLYENDCIFDKFECSVSGDGSSFVTGSYSNLFHIYDRYGANDVCIEASKGNKGRRHSLPNTASLLSNGVVSRVDVETMDFSKKILHTAWHPSHNEVAVATDNSLYVYRSEKGKCD